MQLGLRNVSVSLNLFGVLVLPVLNFGVDIWGVYHLCAGGMQRLQFGIKGEVELMHRKFLCSLLGLRRSVATGPLMHEMRRVPVIHSWVSLMIKWWNRVTSRSDTDLTKECLRASVSDMQLELSVRSTGKNKQGRVMCWARAFLDVLSSVNAPGVDALVRSLSVVPVVDVLRLLTGKWHDLLWHDVHGPPLHGVRALSRDVDHFALHTYWGYFGFVVKGNKRVGYAYHLHRAQQITALARFRLRSHSLAIVTQAWGAGRRGDRDERVCPCCLSAREDELHILECTHHAQARAHFADVIPPRPEGGDPCAWMREIMHPTEAPKWSRLASFIISVVAARDEAEKNLLR
jgi:hypothetical protein